MEKFEIRNPKFEIEKGGPEGPPFSNLSASSYTSPWSIIESAILTKPAMFAPTT